MLDNGILSLSPSHVLHLVPRRTRKASDLAVGDLLFGAMGAATVRAIQRRAAPEAAFTFGFATAAQAPVGDCGVWAVMPNLGPPVRAVVYLSSTLDRTVPHAAA